MMNSSAASPRRLLATGVAVVLVSLALVASGSVAESAVPGSNGKIAFVSDRSGNDDVWAMNPDGTAKVNLTAHAARDDCPDWSPDGSKVAFCSDRGGGWDVWVIDADGSNPANLTADPTAVDAWPVWSPDGSKIAFHSTRSGSWDVWVMDADGSNATNLSSSPTSMDEVPDWSPDGSKIAFASDRSGDLEIWVMDADGSNPTNLTADPGGFDYWPDWSPDGSKIAFESDRTGDFEVWVMDADGTNLANLTGDPAAADGAPSWSPDGSRIAFQSDWAGDFDVWAMDATGSNFTLLTTSTADDGVPDWQSLAGPPPPPGPSPHGVGLFDPATGEWHLRDLNGAKTLFTFGPGNVPFMGDWDCDGVDTPGLYRQSDNYVYLRNSNSTGAADIRFFFGNPDDVPLAGDFNGDGCDTLSIYRPSEQRFYIINQLGANEGALPAADFSFVFGSPADQPFVGDFDGDGIDEVGLFRPSTGEVLLKLTLTSGPADIIFSYGTDGDLFVADDWSGDGMSTVGYYRPAGVEFGLRNLNATGDPDIYRAFGESSWLPVSGRFGLASTLDRPPASVGDGPYAVDEGGTVTDGVPGLLANDADPERGALTVGWHTDPEHGTLVVGPDGSFTYTHDGTETTADSFRYRADDGTWYSNAVEVPITVRPVNDAPVAMDDGPYTAAQGGTLTVNGVLANDTDAEGDNLTASKVSDPGHGTLSLASDGSFVYVHDGTATTTDSFKYRANDGQVSSNIAAVTITIAPAATSVGLVDPSQGKWYLRDYHTAAVNSFFYGNPGDIPFMGDWDCNGEATPGLFRQSDAYAYLRNSNTVGIADIRFYFGDPDDVPLAGDFNGNGCDSLSIYRPSEQRFYIMNELGENEGGLGAAEYAFTFGNPGDKPVVGDWDGDGIDEVGLHRESTGFFYYRNTLDVGIADDQFYFGDPGDRFVAGDWGTIDGVETPAVFRPTNTTFYFRWTNTPGVADSEFVWGEAAWLPVSGVLD